MRQTDPLNPATASVTLRWKVIASQNDEDLDEGRLYVSDVTTEPPSDPDHWQIQSFCDYVGIPLVVGDYGLQYLLGEGLRVLSMPHEVGEDGRQQIIETLESQLHEQTLGLSEHLQSMPTDEQIEIGVRKIVHLALQRLLEPQSPVNEGELATIRDMSEFRPQFLRVSAVPCANHGDDENQVEFPDVRNMSFSQMTAWVQTALQNISRPAIEFGSGRAYLKIDGMNVAVKVGFVDHTSPFALALNELLAERVAQIASQCELEAVLAIIHTLYPGLTKLTRAIEQIADAYQIELNPPD